MSFAPGDLVVARVARAGLLRGDVASQTGGAYRVGRAREAGGKQWLWLESDALGRWLPAAWFAPAVAAPAPVLRGLGPRDEGGSAS